MRTPTTCSAARCGRRAVRGDSRCEAHQREWRGKRTAQGEAHHALYANQRWRAASRQFRFDHPICAACAVEPSAQVDHIQPHRGDAALFWDEDNWQALCARCHGRKSAREASSP